MRYYVSLVKPACVDVTRATLPLNAHGLRIVRLCTPLRPVR